MNGIFEEGTGIFEIGAVTTITGVVLVFTMLLFLVFVLYIFGWVSNAIKKSAEKKAQKAKEELAKQIAAEQETQSVEEPTSVTDDNVVSGEIIAVIAAAVNELYAGSGKKPVIKTVKKSGSRRTAWATAGLSDNTRSF